MRQSFPVIPLWSPVVASKCGVKGALREGPVGVAGGGHPFRAKQWFIEIGPAEGPLGAMNGSRWRNYGSRLFSIDEGGV